MNERGALIRAICESPGCDTARLVFADWLDERGEHDRAGFIRAQCASRGHEFAEWPRDGKWPPFDDWPDSAGSIFAADLADPARCRGFSFRWCRGFIDTVSLPTPTFTDRAALLFVRHPIEWVTLSDVRPELHPSAADTAYGLTAVEIAERPHILVGVATHLDRLFGPRVPLPIWEFLAGHTEEEHEPDEWPHKTFPTLAHTMQALSRACVLWARSQAALPLWEPPCRLV